MPRAPKKIYAAAAHVLSGEKKHRRETFELRLERWWPELWDELCAVYADRAHELALQVVRLAARAYRDRSKELTRLDQLRTLDPDWFQSPRMLGYAAYTERFAGDLAGIRERIPYLRELGINYLHLMPLLLPRDGDNDGGYAVADYRSVRPDLGTIDDLADTAAALRRNGISLVVDLVLNHVAREHAWAVKARSGDPHYRAYFRVFEDRRLPDAYERTLPEVFPDFAPGNFTWDDDLRGWVWTTFNSWQWDVDWSNPDVFLEYADVILFLANLGVEVLRLDAVAFLWKRVGTDSQNQPEVHSITQALRAVARIACPAVAFKAEAIVAPRQLVHYLGQGRHHGRVSDLAYHNGLMVQVWSMLATGDVRLAAHALRELPPIPHTTSWITYVRCHDDIGWSIDDADTAAVGLSGSAHRAFLSDYYSGEYPASSARGLVFQHNQATDDRRISGTTASLAGLEAALTSGSAEQIEWAVQRILLAHALILGWGGLPVLWMGDEIGLLNDPEWAAGEGHGEDNRWAHRPRMQWDLADQRHDVATVPGRLFQTVARMAAVRSDLDQLHASVAPEVGPVVDPGVLAVVRRHPIGALVGLYNITQSWRSYPGELLFEHSLTDPVDALSGGRILPADDGNLWLPPYAAWWIVDR